MACPECGSDAIKTEKKQRFFDTRIFSICACGWTGMGDYRESDWK